MKPWEINGAGGVGISCPRKIKAKHSISMNVTGFHSEKSNNPFVAIGNCFLKTLLNTDTINFTELHRQNH
jgi:hypothetical protein